MIGVTAMFVIVIFLHSTKLTTAFQVLQIQYHFKFEGTLNRDWILESFADFLVVACSRECWKRSECSAIALGPLKAKSLTNGRACYLLKNADASDRHCSEDDCEDEIVQVYELSKPSTDTTAGSITSPPLPATTVPTTEISSQGTSTTTESFTESTTSVTSSTAITTERIMTSAEPSTEVTESSTESTTSVTSSTALTSKRITTSTEPSTEVTEPSTAVSEPSTEVSEPSTEVTQPSTEVTEPSTELTEPTTKVTEPSTEDTNSVTSSTTLSTKTVSTTPTTTTTESEVVSCDDEATIIDVSCPTDPERSHIHEMTSDYPLFTGYGTEAYCNQHFKDEYLESEVILKKYVEPFEEDLACDEYYLFSGFEYCFKKKLIYVAVKCKKFMWPPFHLIVKEERELVSNEDDASQLSCGQGEAIAFLRLSLNSDGFIVVQAKCGRVARVQTAKNKG